MSKYIIRINRLMLEFKAKRLEELQQALSFKFNITGLFEWKLCITPLFNHLLWIISKFCQCFAAYVVVVLEEATLICCIYISIDVHGLATLTRTKYRRLFLTLMSLTNVKVVNLKATSFPAVLWCKRSTPEASDCWYLQLKRQQQTALLECRTLNPLRRLPKVLLRFSNISSWDRWMCEMNPNH